MQKKVPALRSVHQKKRPAKAAKARRSDKREPIADSISALENTIATERDADRKQQKRSERGKSFREWATVILLFVTAGFVFGQWREMQKVYEPIAEQARYTRESYAAVQRAFISDARLALIPKAITDGKPGYWEPKLTVHNSGPTPTKALEYALAFVPTPKRAGDPGILFDAPPSFVNPIRGKVTIGPHATAELALNLLTFQADSANQGSQTEWFSPRGVLTGAIRYRDQFSQSDLHITKFCFAVWETTQSRIYYLLCQHWNCSDDDCKIEEKEEETKANQEPQPPRVP